MPTTKLSRIDRDALERALAMACRESPEQAARYEEMLRLKPWQEVCESAAYSMQLKTLRLKPWQCPPCDCRSDEIGPGYGNSRCEVLLRRRMLKAGISLYEPDPIGALKRGKAASSRAPTASLKSTHAARKSKPSAPSASA